MTTPADLEALYDAISAAMQRAEEDGLPAIYAELARVRVDVLVLWNAARGNG